MSRDGAERDRLAHGEEDDVDRHGHDCKHAQRRGQLDALGDRPGEQRHGNTEHYTLGGVGAEAPPSELLAVDASHCRAFGHAVAP